MTHRDIFMPDLPAWFQKNDNSYFPAPGLEDKKFRLPFLDRTMKALAGLMGSYMASEAFSSKPGLLQDLDPRAKLIGILSLIVSASLIHNIPLLYGIFFLSLILASFSRIPAGYFSRRVWLILPFFAGLIALPAALNLFTPGEPVATLYSLDRPFSLGPYTIPQEISFTRQGISTGLLLIGRVAASFSLILLLVLTTPWTSILKALRSLQVPQIYVHTLGMTLRYLMLFVKSVQEICLARKSRTLRPGRTGAERGWVAGEVGILFRRTMQMSLEVHRAMVARGYGGEVRILETFQMRKRDFLWAGFCAAVSFLVIYFGHG